MIHTDATPDEVHAALEQSTEAFKQYRKKNLKERAHFLRTIAIELAQRQQILINTASSETNLDEARLTVEFKRTLFQLNNYADACEAGNWLDIRIDTADDGRTPPKPDLRKMLVPLGPVVVFGASNFPFAYSTAGGDTASALAAGCTVIKKAHPAHAATSVLAAEAITAAAAQCGISEDVFIHLHCASFEVGKALVQHPLTKAVAFTGSFEGGKALFDMANNRQTPIPVFAEMGSVNPVFLLPQKLKEDAAKVAEMYAGSITQSVGQLCTNPGLLIGIGGDALQLFVQQLTKKIKGIPPAKMLHAGIANNFMRKRSVALSQAGVKPVSEQIEVNEEEAQPTIATVSAEKFLKNPLLHQEVFGPYSLLVICADATQMLEVVKSLEGQLTATLMATANELQENEELVDAVKDLCGRIIINGVPTGVEVALAMHHGGPYPATTDSRFTAVGADALKRFARPVSFQNWSEELLPDELKDANPLGLWRTVNNELTR